MSLELFIILFKESFGIRELIVAWIFWCI